MIRFVNRILDWLMRDAVFDHGELAAGGSLEWRRFRNGFVSGPYMILTNRGGGVLVSCNGRMLNGGRMLPDLGAAQAFCEGHAAGLAVLHQRNAAAMTQSAAAMIPTDAELDEGEPK